MKKCIAVLLCACSLFSLAATAFASDNEPDFIAEYEAQYGKAPVASGFSSDEEYQAAYDVWFAGLVPYVNRRAAEYEQEKATEDQVHAASPESVESVGTKNDVSSNHADTSADSGLSNKYPVGSYVSPAGNVYAADGTLLSPGTAPAMEPGNAPASGSSENDALLSGELADPNSISPDADSDPLVETNPSVFTIKDLRPSDPPAEALTGLKSMVTSIFGEYAPVTTTTVISETVGNDTQQYLVETVASGAAGVDYEWIAGVVLFAIMLYCLMKLLGGVLK